MQIRKIWYQNKTEIDTSNNCYEIQLNLREKTQDALSNGNQQFITNQRNVIKNCVGVGSRNDIYSYDKIVRIPDYVLINIIYPYFQS